MPTVDDVARFKLLDHIFVDRKGNIKKYEVEYVRFHKQFVLLKLKGVDDMNTAETLKGTVVKITEDMAVPCEEDEYYIKDLYDMNVVTVDGEELGGISDVIFTGANDVYAVKDNNGKEILIPAIKDCIVSVDVENNLMTVKLLEGLR